MNDLLLLLYADGARAQRRRARAVASFIAIVVAELAASIVLLQICLDGAKSQMVIAIRRAPQMLDGHEDKRASIRVVRLNDYTK